MQAPGVLSQAQHVRLGQPAAQLVQHIGGSRCLVRRHLRRRRGESGEASGEGIGGGRRRWWVAVQAAALQQA